MDPTPGVVRPHLFTEAEVLRLLDRVNALPPTPTSPLRRENLHLAIVILYTTGLRLGELVRLLLRDYDPHERTLLIRDSKFLHRGLAAEVRPQVYTPLAQDLFNEFFIVLKTTGDPREFIPPARTAVLALDSEQPIADVQTLQERVGLSIARERFSSFLLTLFSCLALVLASVGLYGVMYAVVRRTHELGIRMALGANLTTVLVAVIRPGMTLVFAGICIGWTGATVLTRLLRTLLFDVSATEPLTFVAATLVLAGVAFVACWVPARRATKVDPVVALRCR